MNSAHSVARDFPSVNSAVVRFPQSIPQEQTNQISQAELHELATLRRTARDAEAKAEAKVAELLAKLQAGATVEAGIYDARIGEDSRRTVSWKAVAARLAKRLGFDGDKYCERVLNATKPTTKTILKFE
jgi:hypothetical protein